MYASIPTQTHKTQLWVVFFVVFFTFLQALMDEATVLSVLPPSTSTDSEPSNMADDWKLLQGKKGQGVEFVRASFCQTLLKRSAISEDGCDGSSPFPVTFVHSVQLRLSS